MVNFNFTVDDTMAESLVDLISDQIRKMQEAKVNANVTEAMWYVSHIQYLEQIKKIVVESTTRYNN